MADARTICKSALEKLGPFNDRLAAACDELAVTKFDLMVVDGEPAVTLLSEEVEATQEDVDKDAAEREAAASEPGYEEDPEDTPLEVGDWIPVSDPLVVQVVKIKCGGTPEDAAKSEERCDRLYNRARGAISHHLHATGTAYRWEGDPNSPLNAQNQPTKFVHVPFTATFAAVGYLNTGDDDDKDEDQDDGGNDVERGLRRGKKAPAGK